MENKTVGGYYGSELNKFIDENCTHEMTAINIDLLMYKASKNHIRIIESKHTNEKLGNGQKVILELLAKISRDIIEMGDIKLEVMVIYADPPYNKAYIKNLTYNADFELSRDAFIKFLNFE